MSFRGYSGSGVFSHVYIIKLKLILFFMVVACSSYVYALKSDDQQDMHLDANSAKLDYKNKTTVFTGNVIITRGSIVVHADNGTASEDQEGQRVITLHGTPVTFSQLQEDGDKVEGQGNQFDFNTKTHLAILSGRARIKKGKSIIIGDKITYNTETQVYSADTTSANGINKQKSGRVKIILDQANLKIN